MRLHVNVVTSVVFFVHLNASTESQGENLKLLFFTSKQLLNTEKQNDVTLSVKISGKQHLCFVHCIMGKC